MALLNMIQANKKVGETPLEFLTRWRSENRGFHDERLSYAGRLDPMAEGKMLIMVGAENNQREEFLSYDKEYEATFLFGISTDTGDALGLITNEVDDWGKISQQEIFPCIEDFVKIKTQKYPWFSSKTVDGIKLFEHFKNGNLNIERPTRDVEIKSVEILNFEEINTDEVESYIFESIGKVNGDFRQDEIVARWREFFAKNSRTKLQTTKIKILVSSGTYIRALTENFPFPTILLKLNRTQIIRE